MIHGFWVPDLYGKIDAIPGRINRISFQANQTGEFRGVCAELCGSGHAGMMFRVTALSQDDFNTWVQQQQSGGPPSSRRRRLARPGQGASSCSSRAAPATPSRASPAPTAPSVRTLAGVASRTTIAGGAVPNNGPDDLKNWILNPPAVKPGTAMPDYDLTDDQATQIVAYLETLK